MVSTIGIEIVAKNFKILDSDGFTGQFYHTYKEPYMFRKWRLREHFQSRWGSENLSPDFTHFSLPHASVQRFLVSPIPATWVSSGLLTMAISFPTARLGFTLLRASSLVSSHRLAFQLPNFCCCHFIFHFPFFLNLPSKEIPLLLFLLGLRKEVKLELLNSVFAQMSLTLSSVTSEARLVGRC